MGAGQSTSSKSIEIINRLLTEYIPPTETFFWDELCSAPTSKELAKEQNKISIPL